MSFTFALNGYHDLSINREGKLASVYGPEEVKQRILVSLRHYWEEYFLNVPDGIPWYEIILGSKDLATVESIIRGKILDVPGVVAIVSIDIRFSSSAERQVAIDAVVEVEGVASLAFQNITLTMEG